jgi:DNA-directed RNA polymerase specialized sigma24 family protein
MESRNQQHEAFDRAFAAYAYDVFRFCYAVLLSYEDALIVSQRAWRRAAHLLGGDPDAFGQVGLLKAAANECIGFLETDTRAEQETGGRADVLPWDGTPLEQLHGAAAELNWLKEAVGSLQPRQRVALVLKFWAGMPVGSIAAALSMSPAALQVQVRSGLAMGAEVFCLEAY